MTLLTRKTLLVVLTCALAGLAPLSASAKDVLFPKESVPAYAITLPDDWSTDLGSTDSVIMISANRTAVLVTTWVKTSAELESVAREISDLAKSTTPVRKEPARLAGSAGFTWFATSKTDAGITFRLEVTVVRTDGEHASATSLLLAERVSASDEATARKVLAGYVLVPAKH